MIMVYIGEEADETYINSTLAFTQLTKYHPHTTPPMNTRTSDVIGYLRFFWVHFNYIYIIYHVYDDLPWRWFITFSGTKLFFRKIESSQLGIRIFFVGLCMAFVLNNLCIVFYKIFLVKAFTYWYIYTYIIHKGELRKCDTIDFFHCHRAINAIYAFNIWSEGWGEAYALTPPPIYATV